MAEPLQEAIEAAVARYKMPWPERKALLVQKMCDPTTDPTKFVGPELADYKMMLDEESGHKVDDLTDRLVSLDEMMKAFGSKGLLDMIAQCNAEFRKDLGCD